MSFNLIKHLRRQIRWSRATFGPVEEIDRIPGVIDHLRKELKEIERTPHDLEEWIDVVILGFDGAWRSGHSAQEIVAALEAKQKKNEGRSWPDWRTVPVGTAVEHHR